MGFLHALAMVWGRVLAVGTLLAHLVAGVLFGHALVVTPPASFSLGGSYATSSAPVAPTPLFPAASSTPPATISTRSTPAKPVKKPSSAPAMVQTTAVTPPALPAALDPALVDAATRAALVNILCTTKASGYFNPLSGSGVIIDSRGVILTNAHVGQYFLLRDYPAPDSVECVVRTGSPAQPKYTAKLLYLPPVWVAANAAQVGQLGATGTGENDYAFLLITGTTDSSPLPPSFAALPMTIDEVDTGLAVLLAAYPAELLGGATIQQDLYISSTLTQTDNLFTFASTTNNTVDLVSVGGTIVSQEGSSGGAVVRLAGSSLTGIIATESKGATTAARDLRAITLAHINRSLALEGQGGIVGLLTGDIEQKADAFNATTAVEEGAELVDALNRR